MTDKQVDFAAIQAEALKQTEELKKFAYSLLSKEAIVEVEKAKAAGAKPFTVQIGEDLYVYRVLSRFEYKAMTLELAKQAASIMGEAEDQATGRLLVQMRTEEAIVKKACIFPAIDDMSIKIMPAGVIETLHNSIMSSSGFGQEVIPVKL